MEGTIKPPSPLSNKGDMAENWERWKKDFMIFMQLSNYIDKPQDIKAYLLRNYIGEVGQNAIQKLVFENVSDRDNVFKLIEKLDAHFKPINEVVVRYHFFTRYRKQDESIEDYINDLKIKAEPCKFGNLTNSLIRDKVIADLKDKTLRKKLFEVKNLDVPKLVSMYNEHMAVEARKNQYFSENTKPKDTVRNCCWKCNQIHPIRRCPAWNSKCENCGEYHHYTNCCRRNNLSRKEQKERNKYNPNKYETSYNIGNMQRGNTVNPEIPPKLRPTAPPSNVDNRLYPDLNYVNTSETKMGDKPKNMTQNEHFQRSGPTMPGNVPRQYNTASMQTPEPTESTCILS